MLTSTTVVVQFSLRQRRVLVKHTKDYKSTHTNDGTGPLIRVEFDQGLPGFGGDPTQPKPTAK